MFKPENSDLSDEIAPTPSLSELSNFSYALEGNSDMSELENTDFSDKFSNFLAFSEKRNSVSLFYFPIGLLVITNFIKMSTEKQKIIFYLQMTMNNICKYLPNTRPRYDFQKHLHSSMNSFFPFPLLELINIPLVLLC